MKTPYFSLLCLFLSLLSFLNVSAQDPAKANPEERLHAPDLRFLRALMDSIPAWYIDLTSPGFYDQLGRPEDNPYTGFYGINGVQVNGKWHISAINSSDLATTESREVGRLEGGFPVSFVNLPRLRSLRVGGTRVRGVLPDSIRNLSFLEELDVSNTSFSGPIPDSLFLLPKLNLLDLSDTNISGSFPEYPLTLDPLTREPYLEIVQNLEVINLANTEIEGNIPNYLGEIISLKELNLSGTPLNGSIPSSLGQLENLEILDLQKTSVDTRFPVDPLDLDIWLEGNIPESFGNLKNLKILNVTANHLFGPIPNSLANLNLITFAFSNTALCVPDDSPFRNWLFEIENVVGGNFAEKGLIGNCRILKNNELAIGDHCLCENKDFVTKAVEVNQAIQSAISFFENPDIVSSYENGIRGNPVHVPIVPNKPTLVRYYLLGKEARLQAYKTDLLVEVYGINGLLRSEVLEPNIQSYPLVKDAPIYNSHEEEDLLMEMRINLNQTLNFVIPPEWLPYAATKMRIALLKEITDPETGVKSLVEDGIKEVDIDPPVELGITYFRLYRDEENLTQLNSSDVILEAPRGYLKGSLPISELFDANAINDIMIKPNEEEFEDFFNTNNLIENSGVFYAHFFKMALTKNYLSPIQRGWDWFIGTRVQYISQYGFYNENNRHLVAGIFANHDDNIPEGASYGDFIRNGVSGMLVSELDGSTLAHEIGHTLGFLHAGGMHGECNGPLTCDTNSFPIYNEQENEKLPFMNGTLNADSKEILNSDFGAAISYAEDNWNVMLVDPCPKAGVNSRKDCEALAFGADIGANTVPMGNYRPFDFMSYGTPHLKNNFNLEKFPFFTFRKAWVSSLNYKRIYDVLSQKDVPFNIIKRSASEDQQQIFEIYGIYSPGTVKITGTFTARRRVIESNDFQLDKSTKSLLFKLFDKDNRSILSGFVRPERINDARSDISDFHIGIPLSKPFHRIEITDSTGNILLDQTVSDHIPALSIPSVPTPHADNPDWLALPLNSGDMDGDPLTYKIEYSPDLGESWLPLAIVIDTVIQSFQIPFSNLSPSDSALFKVSVTDGLQSSVAISPTSFCIGNPGTCTFIPVESDELGNILTNNPSSLSSEIKVYPNPAYEKILIDINGSAKPSPVLSLYNAKGMLVSYYQALEKGINELDISFLPVGIYWLRIQNGEQSLTKAIQIE